MGDRTKIQWADATWAVSRGCSRVSPGCQACYAERIAHRFSGEGMPYAGLTNESGRWNGNVRFLPDALDQPLRWTRPRRIFVNSTSDLFHEKLTNEQIAAVFGVMAAAPQHTFQVLTKRPERMRAWFEWVEQNGTCREQSLCRDHAAALGVVTHGHADWPLPNVWLGVSIEDQKTADERIPLLLQTPAAVRFVSAEPLLEPVSLSWALPATGYTLGNPDVYEPALDHEPELQKQVGGAFFSTREAAQSVLDSRDSRLPSEWNLGHLPGRVYRLHGGAHDSSDILEPEMLGAARLTERARLSRVGRRDLDWIIVGGESGPGARPMHPDWARSLRDQCAAAGTAFFFKQWGEWVPGENVTRTSGVVDTAKWFDGAWIFGREILSTTDGHHDDEPDLYRVGKKTLGDLLDGARHHEFPATPTATTTEAA